MSVDEIENEIAKEVVKEVDVIELEAEAMKDDVIEVEAEAIVVAIEAAPEVEAEAEIETEIETMTVFLKDASLNEPVDSLAIDEYRHFDPVENHRCVVNGPKTSYEIVSVNPSARLALDTVTNVMLKGEVLFWNHHRQHVHCEGSNIVMREKYLTPMTNSFMIMFVNAQDHHHGANHAHLSAMVDFHRQFHLFWIHLSAENLLRQSKSKMS